MNSTFFYILIIAFICLLPIYIKAEKSFGFAAATAFKLLLSLIFTLTGILGLLYIKEGTRDILFYSNILIVVGLAFAFLGDFFLQYIKKNRKMFHIGVVCFSITQIFLLVSMTMNYGFGWAELILLIVPLGIAVVLMNKQNWELGDSRIFLSAYTFLIALMTSKAFISLFMHYSLSNLIFALGASLFFASDVLLGVWSFYKNKRLYANLNWITYFCGLMLIAISVALV